MSSPSTRVNEWDADKLERAAKYMRELDKSKYASSAIELARREQDVEIARHNALGKQADAARVAEAANVERVRWEEQRKTIEYKNKHEMSKVEYQLRGEQELVRQKDQLSRKRDEDNRRAALEDERVKVAIRRQAEEELQEVRRKADEHRALLERESMRVRALAEADGRIKEQRVNEDVISRASLQRLEQERATRLESIAAVFGHLSTHLSAFVSDPVRLSTTVLGITAVAGCIYGMREMTRVVGHVIDRRLGTPSLVRETSRFSGILGLGRRLTQVAAVGLHREGYSLQDVVVKPELQTRLSRLSQAIQNTHRNAAPHRHLLFYGPPGTGKTMVAKRLARSSGMDYAVMSGGDVGPLGPAAVTELHRLFEWSRTSSRGLLLFIDEADAFLSSRSRAGMSENHRNALNALLFQTGEASRHCMLVLASNRPEDLDPAVADRVDDALLFDLPDQCARERLVLQYFDAYIARAGENARQGPWGLLPRLSARISVDPDVDSTYLGTIAQRTDGFSGREIAKLFIAVQGAVYGVATPLLNRSLLEEVLSWKLLEHVAKRSGFAPSSRSLVADFVSSSALSPPAPVDVMGDVIQMPPSNPQPVALSFDVSSRLPVEPSVLAERITVSSKEKLGTGSVTEVSDHRKGRGDEVRIPLAVPVGGVANGLTDIV